MQMNQENCKNKEKGEKLKRNWKEESRSIMKTKGKLRKQSMKTKYKNQTRKPKRMEPAQKKWE